MKKFLALFLSIIMMATVFAGCSQNNNQKNSSNSSSSSSTKTSSKSNVGNSQSNSATKHIAVIVKTTNSEYWATVDKGAEDAAKELGVQISYQGAASETDIASQINFVENAINNKVDGIVLAASNPDSLAPYVDKAVAAGIPVVGIDSQVNSDKISSFIATNNEAAAAEAADKLAELIGKKGKVAIVNFTAGAGTAIAREKGFKDEIAKEYPDIKIVATQYCDADAAKALSITQDLITANPDLAGIFAANEPAANGVVRAIEQRNLSGKIKVVGFDSSDTEIASLQAGSLQAMIVQNPYKMGYLGIQTIVDIINGKSVPKQIDTGATVVTKDNLNNPDVQKLLYPMGKK
jgi:ribose transport system substrate-binding protein